MSRDMLRLGLPLGALAVIVSAVGFGTRGLWSSLVGVVLVLANLYLTGIVVSRAAANSAVAAMAAALVSFFGLLVFLTVFVIFAHGAGWMNLRVFGISMIALHLALVGLEARKVSGRLAFSGFFPSHKERD
ncbi:MAG: hypothetical protein M0000_11235 [Actinomycetota bacterium]|nr:hypothetical protein [Actinomycetota bacterium]